MSRLKDIFSNKPESMSILVKWVFGIPLAYLGYLIISMILPNSTASANAVLICQALRSLLLAVCVIIVLKLFLNFDVGFNSKFFTASGKWNHGLFFKGFYLMTLAQIVTNLCLYFIFPQNFEKFPLDSSFIINWVFSLVLVTVAAFSEELIFRCYVAWFGKTKEDNLCREPRKIIIYSLVSALLFALAHFSNPEVDESAVCSMLFYFIFGFGLMLCFFKTKGVEFSFGVHVANNLFAAWFVNYESSVLPTDSIFVSTLPIDFITVQQAVICVLFCVLLCPDNDINYE